MKYNNDTKIFLIFGQMIAIEGIYENGKVRLNRKIQTKKAMKVVVTFLEDNDQSNNRLSLKDFSFLKSRKKSKRYKGSISDSLIEERRSDL